jgi:hypothetical protein
MAHDDAIVRLARQIDAARRDEQLLVNPDAIVAFRRRGAGELHRICAEFVSAVNSKLSGVPLELSPPTYAPETFRESGANLMQIGSQGRELQIAFEAPPQTVSTAKFRIPYVLEGEVRAYNQKMLERFEIRSRAIFFCVEKETAVWRFYDWRTLHTGPVGVELFVDLMQPLF